MLRFWMRSLAGSIVGIVALTAAWPSAASRYQALSGDRTAPQKVSTFSLTQPAAQTQLPANRDTPAATPLSPTSSPDQRSPDHPAASSPERRAERDPEQGIDADQDAGLVKAASPKNTASANSASATPKAPKEPALDPNSEEFWLEQAPQQPRNDVEQALALYAQLYASHTALGVVAVGAAEGTYQVFIQKGELLVRPTAAYYGHIDPGNLSWGERVTNYGPCSDQGRSGGNIAKAEELCAARLRDRLPVLLADLYQAGIDPYVELEALLNAADLYNQASPVHSRRFPEALAIAKRSGFYGPEAYAWARTASFYLDANGQLDLERGSNKASGLIGICAREGRAQSQWECVYRDQARRVNEISAVYKGFLAISGAQGES
jgi:hypothetical protein